MQQTELTDQICIQSQQLKSCKKSLNLCLTGLHLTLQKRAMDFYSQNDKQDGYLTLTHRNTLTCHVEQGHDRVSCSLNNKIIAEITGELILYKAVFLFFNFFDFFLYYYETTPITKTTMEITFSQLGIVASDGKNTGDDEEMLLILVQCVTPHGHTFDAVYIAIPPEHYLKQTTRY